VGEVTGDVVVHLDEPGQGAVIDGLMFRVRGWATTAATDAVLAVAVHSSEGPVATLGAEARPDVVAAFPSRSAFGFNGVVESPTAGELADLELVVTTSSGATRHPLGLIASPRLAVEVAAFASRKAAKLARLATIIRCPSCHQRPTTIPTGCPLCDRAFAAPGRHVDLLPVGLSAFSAATAHVSANAYDDVSRDLIATSDLVLDNGSGLRSEYFENVINLEIVDFVTTDVLGDGEHLPFDDGVFDAVLSLAVLEHVRNPFACAAEIARVLKPGGRVYAAVPFLQPLHGYPDHYYNMTTSGLRQLFEGDFDIVSAGVPRAGLPIFTLSWFLGSYLAGLPPEVADTFRSMTVGQLTAPAPEQWDEPYVAQLSDAANEELASVTYVVGRRR
jgi:SAM-dependent methyltransferase